MKKSNRSSNQGRSRANGKNGGQNSAQNMLTGGTRDVKPQMLTIAVAESATDTTTTITQALPVLRNFSSGNGTRSQIVEILKVFCLWGNLVEVDSLQTLCIGTKNLGTTLSVADPTVFAWFRRQVAITTSGQYMSQSVDTFDCTDGSGNGILVATDNIYCQIGSTAVGSAVACTVKVLYRIYGASVLEYVGIVQGQQ